MTLPGLLQCGQHPAQPYTEEQLVAIRSRLRELLPADFIFTQG